MALTKMVNERTKIISEALPSSMISFRTMCWPVKAARVAKNMK